MNANLKRPKGVNVWVWLRATLAERARMCNLYGGKK
jgi:hypothetical protein